MFIPAGRDGKHRLIGTCAFASNGTGRRVWQIRKNGTTTIARAELVPGASALSGLSLVTEDEPVAGDYYELTGTSRPAGT